MQCPACSTTLTRGQYEGVPVYHCAGCQGYLVATKRAADINRSRGKSPAELSAEATLAAEDSRDKLRCPRCRGPMMKEPAKAPEKFYLDKCRECQFVWFDAGELAKIQIAYEATARSQEATLLQERHRQMDPAAKEQFEENLANLPESKSTIEMALGEALLEALLSWPRVLRRR